MSGRRPKWKLSCKRKGTQERAYFGAAWEPDDGDTSRGVTVKIDSGWRIVAPDGTEYVGGSKDEANAYFDLYINDGNGGGQSHKSPQRSGGYSAQPEEDFSDDDLPF